MRAVVQRVREAAVEVEQDTVGRIGHGFLVYVGICAGDEDADCQYIAQKIAGLRAFEDEQGKMNLPISDVEGSVLLVSQFTLCGDCRKGRRPDFFAAAPPGDANALYLAVAQQLRNAGITVRAGRFQADMQVYSINDGPVTLLLDSRKTF